MELTGPVKRILENYESDNPGTKANLARILLQRRKDEAFYMLGKIIKIYHDKD